MKKGILTLVLIITFSMIAPAILPVAGNLNTVEAAGSKANVKKTVKNFFKYAKQLNCKKMQSCVTSDCKETVGGLEVTPALTDYMKKRNKSLSYSIKSVKVSGKTATVKVKCKYLNSENAYVKMLEEMFTKLLSDIEAGKDYSNYSEEEQGKVIDELIEKSLANNPKAYETKYKTKTFNIKLKKVRGKWKISKIDKNLLDAITSNYQSAGEKYFESWVNASDTPSL